MLRHVEQILLDTPEVESFSRRTGARLALAIAEPNTGDFLVKLRPNRKRSTEEVIDELREKIHDAEPALHTEFPGVLSDLIGDLTWSPKPCEIKIFSNDTELLKKKAEEIAENHREDARRGGRRAGRGGGRPFDAVCRAPRGCRPRWA